MEEKSHLYFFIFCLILCQAIIEVSSEDVGVSNSLARRKRVIDSNPNEAPLRPGEAPFVANIREFPANITICIGAILSKHTVLTAAICVNQMVVEHIKILVGSTYSFRGLPHNVIEKKIHAAAHHDVRYGGIALLTIAPAIALGGNTAPIDLHQGLLLKGTQATVFGWGCNPKAPYGTNYRYRMRSISVPILDHRECVNIYKNWMTITDADICTYDPNKRCGHTDVGAPLVVDNKLAGIHVWTGKTPSHINPDVFLVVQHIEYAQWIQHNIIYNMQ